LLQGIFFGFAGYAIFSCSDAFIKHAGSTSGLFVIGFFVTLFSMIPWLATRKRDEQWRALFKARRPWLMNLRGITGVLASMMSIYSFTHLPIAEAYALIFLVPFAVTLFSVIILGEKVSWQRWLAVAIGFAGILLVIRPGFREISLAHAAGVGVAVFGGLSVVLTRLLSASESKQTQMAVLFSYLLVAYFLMMLPQFQMPAGSLMLTLFAAGLCSGCGHLLILSALNRAPANRVGPMQYTQILWAVILGAVFFAEFPDAVTYAGLAVVGLSGVLAFLGAQRQPSTAIAGAAAEAA
jgi:drug/metabolite transporter (DMT)-like permease